MAWRFPHTTIFCEGNVISFSTAIDNFENVLKIARSRAKAHHLEQQDMLMIFRATCWELENLSWKGRGYQQ